MSQLFERFSPYKNIFKNFTSLSALQLSNYIFPIILLPYLVRVLGVEKYGLIQFAAAFNGYYLLLCEFGFGLTGTRLISQNRSDQKKLSEIFSTIFSTKILFYFLSLLILLLIVLSIERFSQDWKLYIYSSVLVLGNVVSPLWFFQGIERMKYIAIINISIRVAGTILVFIFIKASSDYLLFVILNSLTFLIIGLIGLLTVILKFKIQLRFQSLNKIMEMLKYGWNIFLSSVWINLYTTSNTFLLGIFTNDTIVGYFSAADKIKSAFQGIHSTLSLSVFPFVSNLVKESYDKFLNFNSKLLKLAGISAFIISAMLFLFSHQITEIILGNNFSYSAELLKIISVLPFLISLSNVMGIQTMIPLGFDKSFNKIIASAAIIHIIVLLIVIQKYSAFGVAYTVVLTEFLVTLFMFIFLKSKKINIFV